MLTTTLVSSPDLQTFHRLHSAVSPPYTGGGLQHPLHLDYPVCDLRDESPGMGSPLPSPGRAPERHIGLPWAFFPQVDEDRGRRPC